MAVAIEGGAERDHPAYRGSDTEGLGLAEQSVLAALHAMSGPVSPVDLIRDLECAGLRNPDIRSAIWHLLDRHRIRLTRDLCLVLPIAPSPNPGM
ncbi:MAG: hypothetical protein QM589_01030 [Thermomicrobiales bacterium]